MQTETDFRKRDNLGVAMDHVVSGNTGHYGVLLNPNTSRFKDGSRTPNWNKVQLIKRLRYTTPVISFMNRSCRIVIRLALLIHKCDVDSKFTNQTTRLRD